MNNSAVNPEYLEIDLFALIKAMWKRAWIFILCCVLCACAGFSYARFEIAPTYNASVMLYVNNSSFALGSTTFSFNASELAAAQSLVDTYIIILSTRTTLNEVIARGGLDLTYEQLNSMVSASAVKSTEVFRVTVTSTDPVLAAHIANTIAEVLPSKVANIVEGSSVRLVDFAVVPTRKAGPNLTMYAAMGLLIGLVLSCVLVLMAVISDDKIHEEDFLTKRYGVPILAAIPNLRKGSGNMGYAYATVKGDDSDE